MALLYWFRKHICNNHFEQVQTQLERLPFAYSRLNIKRKPDSIFDYEFADFEVLDYQHHAAIKAPVAVEVWFPFRNTIKIKAASAFCNEFSDIF